MKNFIAVSYKKFITLVLSCLLICTALAIPASAAGGALWVSEASAKPGETVTVTAGLSTNPGIAALRLNISYDSSKLTKVSFSAASYMDGTWQSMDNNVAFWIKTNGNSTYTGTIIQMTFTVNEGASGYAAVSLGTSTCEFFNFDEEYVPFSVGSGGVSIESHSHSYSYSVTKEPTGSAAGLVTGSCSCGDTQTVTLPELTASDYSYKVTKEATQTAEGEATWTLKDTSYGAFVFKVTIPKKEAPATEPTNPGTNPGETPSEPTNPGTNPADPETNPSKPGTESGTESGESTKPEESTKPDTGTSEKPENSKPTENGKTEDESTKPETTEEPAKEPTAGSEETAKPEAEPSGESAADPAESSDEEQDKPSRNESSQGTQDNPGEEKTCTLHWAFLVVALLMLALLFLLRGKSKTIRWLLYGLIAAVEIILAVLAIISFGCYASTAIAAASIIAGVLIIVKT